MKKPDHERLIAFDKEFFLATMPDKARAVMLGHSAKIIPHLCVSAAYQSDKILKRIMEVKDA